VSLFANLKGRMRAFGSTEKKFLFGIPLIGSHLTEDFERVCSLLGNTLVSCLQQTDANFEIYVACNEIPDARFVPSSPKIHFILTERLNKTDLEKEPRADVSLKRDTLMNAAANARASYYCLFDADDLVSKNLVASIRKSGNPNGYLLGAGYLLDSRTQSLYLFPNSQFLDLPFYELCGSSIVVTLDPSPNAEAAEKNMRYLKGIIWPGHDKAQKSFIKEGRPALVVNFPACIYRANHGSNLYLRLNRSERTSFIDTVASTCKPLAGPELAKVRMEFCFA
jgi:hypothetical protein